jgi:hypothetical protein
LCTSPLARSLAAAAEHDDELPPGFVAADGGAVTDVHVDRRDSDDDDSAEEAAEEQRSAALTTEEGDDALADFVAPPPREELPLPGVRLAGAPGTAAAASAGAASRRSRLNGLDFERSSSEDTDDEVYARHAAALRRAGLFQPPVEDPYAGVLRRSARKNRPARGFGEESSDEDERDDKAGAAGRRRGNWYRHVMAARDWAGAAVARLPPEALTAQLLTRSGFPIPLALRPSSSSPLSDDAASSAAAAALGMRLPPAPLSVADIAAGVGGATLVPTLDVARQGDGPRGLTLDAFAAYWADPAARKRRLLNVVSLALARTPLGEWVAPPAAVSELDLVASAWPNAAHDAHDHPFALSAAETRVPLAAPAPEVLLYALMSPAGSYTDWHCDFGGSSVWYHLLSGRKAFLLAPPSAQNLAAFEAWASSAAQAREFLGDALDGMQRVEVAAGDTLLIPAARARVVT